MGVSQALQGHPHLCIMLEVRNAGANHSEGGSNGNCPECHATGNLSPSYPLLYD